GTEVSLRMGGQGVGSMVWYLKGHASGGALGGTGGYNQTYLDGPGGPGGNLALIPLNTHSFSNTAAPVGFAHSRSSEWDFSAKQTRLFLDARSPSPYGEVKGYFEVDFGPGNTSVTGTGTTATTSSFLMRIRQGYAAMGGLLMG